MSLWFALLSSLALGPCAGIRRPNGGLPVVPAMAPLSSDMPCDGGFRFATWNIQNLGTTKAARSEVMKALALTITRYDVVAVQELVQTPTESTVCGPNTMSAICDLQAYINEASPRNFSLEVSPRIGDEQYVIIYDPTIASVVETGVYPDNGDLYARPPYTTVLSVAGSRIAIANVHVRPREADREIGEMPHVGCWMQTTFEADHNMIVGDFNADGGYFNDDRDFPPVLAQMPDWCKLTPNHLNSTVATSSNSYDRILASCSLSATQGEVFVVQNFTDLSAVLTQGCQDGYLPGSVCDDSSSLSAADAETWRIVMHALSDHYPVETCMRPAVSSPSPSPECTPRPTTTTGPPTPAPPPALNPGDCAVVGVHSVAPDDIAIVLFAPLPAGKTIFVTDNGVFSDGSLRRTEGILYFTPPEDVAPGTVLRLADWSHEEGNFALNNLGDQVIVFAGTMEHPAYVCAATTDNVWQSNATSWRTSALPLGLVDGVSALAFRHVDNLAYVGATQGTAAELQGKISDLANWETSNRERPHFAASFTVG